MKITFLGTAAATSFPLTFCMCKNCVLARQFKGKSIRKRSSLLIDDQILIDLGPDCVTSLNMYDKDISKIKYLLQTHPHSDHFDAGHFVTRWSEYATVNAPHLDIFAHSKCFKKMDEMIKQNEDIDIFNPDWQKDLNISLNSIKHSECVNLNEYNVTAVESLHDTNQGSLLYLIEKDNKKILYATDTTPFSEKALSLLSNQQINCLILDHTYGNVENCGGHLNEKQFRDEISKLKNVKAISNSTRIFATHISHEGCSYHEEMATLTHGLYEIAYDGLEFEV